MKKLLIPCVAAIAVLAVSANAEELPYVWELPQYTYIRSTLLSEESYPEVCINPEYASGIFSSYADPDPVYLCFPGPDGASCESFDTSEASYLDVDNDIQYSYQVVSSYSFEVFLNEAEDESWILLDGADGTAARIDPESGRAYGLIATEEFDKSSKLYIMLGLDDLDSKMPLDTRVQALSDAILAEVSRVNEAMHYEHITPYWTTGKFAGAKLLDYEFKNYLEFDFPTLTVSGPDGSDVDAPLTITSVDGTRIEGVVDFGEGVYVDTEINFDDYSYAQNNLEENEEGTSIQRLENGSTWTLYVSNKNDDGTIYSWHASKDLGIQNEYEEEYYLSIHMSGNGILWDDEADVMNDVAKFDNYLLVDSTEDVYVPSEKPAGEETEDESQPAEGSPEEASAETWTCPECGTENTGNFCTNCGAAKPSETWTCPDCGTENTGNFCTNCGAARP